MPSYIVVGGRIYDKVIEPVESIFAIACGRCPVIAIIKVYGSGTGTCGNATDFYPKNAIIPIDFILNPIIQLGGTIALGETDIPKICPAVIIEINILPAVGTASVVDDNADGIIGKQAYR